MKRITQFFSSGAHAVSWQERILSAFLAFVATMVCLFIGSFFLDITNEPVYIASLGASAMLLFTAPSSPFSQPWPVLGSHLISSLVGVFCFEAISYFPLSAALAVGLSVLFMHLFRCLHPPGGAAALAVILGSTEIHQMSYQYILSPVLINVLLLLALCYLINNIVPGRSYPNKALATTESAEKKMGIQTSLYNQADLETALTEMDSYIDISRADLHRIYRLAVSHANQRRIGDVTCKKIMTKNVVTFEYSTELSVAWETLHKQKLKGAAVVDGFQRVIGVVTIQDFVHYAEINTHKDASSQIRQFLTRTEGSSSDKLEVVGQIMSSPPVCIAQDTHILHLVDVFSENHFHHLPIVDEKKYLVGIVTRSDLMNALSVLHT